MACYSVATTSVRAKVTLTQDVAERMLEQFLGKGGHRVVSLPKGFRIDNGPISMSVIGEQVTLRNFNQSFVRVDEREKFDALLLQAQKAVVLQKLQQAGKVSEVRQVKGGTVMKVRVA